MNKKNTIGLEVRSISSPDVEFYAWEPLNNSDVFFLVEIAIGEAGVKGSDVFQIVVATPEGLRARSRVGEFTIRERCTLIVSNYNWAEIKKSLETIVRKCEGENWSTSTLNLQRFFNWEYEDYKLAGQRYHPPR